MAGLYLRYVLSEANIAEINALRAENEALRLRVQSAESRADLAEQNLALLQHQVDQLKRLIFGVKSERFEPASGPDQLMLFGTPDQE